jgi:hypothetical protein
MKQSTDWESFWCEVRFADRLCKISDNGNEIRATKSVNKSSACAAQVIYLKRSIRLREERVAGVDRLDACGRIWKFNSKTTTPPFRG